MLTRVQLDEFHTAGFLCVENVVTADIRRAVEAEYASLMDELCERFGIAPGHRDSSSFMERFSRLMTVAPEAYEWLDISLPMRADLRSDAGCHAGPAVFDLLRHAGLLDIVESVIGPEIYSNPVQHVRIKPPERQLTGDVLGNSNIARTFWHQDAAVVLEDADDTPILTVWVAMTDATIERGCMHAIAGSHRWPTLGLHCPGKTGLGEIYIPDALAEAHRQVPLEVKAGGVVLLNRKTWHGAGPNRSDRLRWSFDLRYQPPGLPTGRNCFPGFLARSTASPDAVLDDAVQWRASWLDARDAIATGRVTARFNSRWTPFASNPLCA